MTGFREDARVGTPETREAPQSTKPRGRGARPQGPYWVLLAAALAALFVAAPPWSLWLRASCVGVFGILLWAGLRFAEAMNAGRARSARSRPATPEPQPRTAPSWALALPGICGYLVSLAFLVATRVHLPREDRDVVGITWFGLTGPLFVASLCGLVAAFDRPGRFRGLAIVANGGYALSTVLYVYLLMRPRY